MNDGDLGLKAGSVYVALGGLFDGGDFARFRREIAEARRVARDPIEARLRVTGASSAQVDSLTRSVLALRAAAAQTIHIRVAIGGDSITALTVQLAAARAEANRLANQLNLLGGQVVVNSQQVNGLNGNLGRLRLGDAAAGAGLLTGAIFALTGGLVALAGAIAPAAGALGALPALSIAAGQSLGAIKLGWSGITEAVSAADKANGEAAGNIATALDAQVSAVDSLRTAEDSVGRAQQAAIAAQRALTQARADGRRELVDLRLAAEDAALAERGAVLSVAEARERLAEVQSDRSYSATDVAQAKLGVDEAVQGQREARIRSGRTSADSRDAQAGGVEGLDSVQSAAKAQQDSQDAVAEALKGVAKAQEQVADATKASTAAANKSHDALDKLTPAQRKFAEFLLTLKGTYRDLQETASAGLLPGVESGIRSAMQNIEPLKRVLGATATELGKLAAAAGAMVGSAGFGRDFETVGTGNIEILDNLGTASGHVATALRNIAVEGQPLAVWLSEIIVSWGEYLDVATTAGRESGGLAAYFDRARSALERLGEITRDVSVGIGNIAEVGRKALGEDLLNSIVTAAAEFRSWTESAEGENALQQFFENSREPLEALGEAVKAFAGLLLTLSETGAITMLLDMATAAIEATDALLKAAPWLHDIAAGLVAISLAGAGLRVLYALTGLRAVVSVIMGLSSAFGLLSGAQVLAGLTALRAGAQMAIGWLLALGPIGLIIAAVAAVAAGLIYAYKHSERFAAIVDGALKWVKGAAADTWSWLRTAGANAWDWISQAARDTGSAIKGVFTGIVNKVSAAFRAIKGFVSDYLVNPVRSGFSRITSAIGQVPNKIRSIMSSVGRLIASPFEWAWGKIKPILDKISSITSAPGKLAGKVAGLVGISAHATGGRIAGGDPQLRTSEAGIPYIVGDQPAGVTEWVVSPYGPRQDNIAYLGEAAGAMGMQVVPAFALGGRVGSTAKQVTRLQSQEQASEASYTTLQRTLDVGGLTAAENQQLVEAKRAQAALYAAEQAALTRGLGQISKELPDVRRTMQTSRGKAYTAAKAKRDDYLSQQKDWQDRAQTVRQQIDTLGLDVGDLVTSGASIGLTDTAFDSGIERLRDEIRDDKYRANVGEEDRDTQALEAALRGRYDDLHSRLSGQAEGSAGARAIQDALDQTYSDISSLGQGAGSSMADQLSSFNSSRFELMSSYGSNIREAPQSVVPASTAGTGVAGASSQGARGKLAETIEVYMETGNLDRSPFRYASEFATNLGAR